MKHRLVFCAVAALLAGPGTAAAGSTQLDIDKLQYDTVYDAARRGVLATDSHGKPLTLLLRIGKGQFLPPHGANGGIRLLTVVAGTLSWGDGKEITPDAERRFGPGSVIVVPAQGGEHWAAAREDDVLLQIVIVGDGALAPSAAAQVAR